MWRYCAARSKKATGCWDRLQLTDKPPLSPAHHGSWPDTCRQEVLDLTPGAWPVRDGGGSEWHLGPVTGWCVVCEAELECRGHSLCEEPRGSSAGETPVRYDPFALGNRNRVCHVWVGLQAPVGTRLQEDLLPTEDTNRFLVFRGCPTLKIAEPQLSSSFEGPSR